MMRLSRWPWWALVLVLLAACRTSDGVFENGPRLVSEVTLPPITLAPTRALSPTPEPTTTPPPTDIPPIVTLTADRSLVVTPTLPPSKTATVTPSVTATLAHTATPAPTREIQVQAQPQPTILVPTMVFMPPPTQPVVVAANPTLASPSGDVSLPLPGVPNVPAASCSTPWFFTYPVLPDCPPNAAVESQAAFQFFEYGYMIWVGAQDAIYVIYTSAELPQWQVFQDTFEEGMPESDPSLDSQAPAYANWQPKRGFGLIWRNQPNVKNRLGWAQSAYEHAYFVQIQTRTDGTIFMRDPNGRLLALASNGRQELYG